LRTPPRETVAARVFACIRPHLVARGLIEEGEVPLKLQYSPNFSTYRLEDRFGPDAWSTWDRVYIDIAVIRACDTATLDSLNTDAARSLGKNTVVFTAFVEQGGLGESPGPSLA
jgi:hypothetical protein